MATSLEELEQQVAQSGLTHAGMLDFFRLLPTSDPTAILPTFTAWVDQLREAGVEVEEDWYDRAVSEFKTHGRLQNEFLLQAPPAPIVLLGDDDTYE